MEQGLHQSDLNYRMTILAERVLAEPWLGTTDTTQAEIQFNSQSLYRYTSRDAEALNLMMSL